MDKKKINPKVPKNNEDPISTNTILNYFPLKNTNSKITCYGRPNIKQLKSMISIYNINFIVTLQHAKEKPEIIGTTAKALGVEWFHIPLEGANGAYLSKKETKLMFIKGVNFIFSELKMKTVNLFVHCAAGVHRTGIFLYSLLRMSGESPEIAYEALNYIRKATYLGVGSNRLDYIEKCILPNLLLEMNNQLKEPKLEEIK